jgi:hypothetical protein
MHSKKNINNTVNPFKLGQYWSNFAHFSTHLYPEASHSDRCVKKQQKSTPGALPGPRNSQKRCKIHRNPEQCRACAEKNARFVVEKHAFSDEKGGGRRKNLCFGCVLRGKLMGKRGGFIYKNQQKSAKISEKSKLFIKISKKPANSVEKSAKSVEKWEKNNINMPFLGKFIQKMRKKRLSSHHFNSFIQIKTKTPRKSIKKP